MSNTDISINEMWGETLDEEAISNLCVITRPEIHLSAKR